MGRKLGLLALLMAACPALWAGTLCSDYAALTGNPSATSATLQDYINAGSCQEGNLLFTGFSYTYLLGATDSVDPNVQASSVTVTVTGLPTDPTFVFMADWLVSDGFESFLDVGLTSCALNALGVCSGPALSPLVNAAVSFTGTVQDLRQSSTDNPSSIYATDLGFSPLGSAPINFYPSLTPPPCATPQTGCPNDTYMATIQTSTSVGSVQQLSVGDQFLLNSGQNGSGGGSGNTAQLSELTVTFSDAPEPDTLAAVGLGLAGFGWAFYRLRRRR